MSCWILSELSFLLLHCLSLAVPWCRWWCALHGWCLQ